MLNASEGTYELRLTYDGRVLDWPAISVDYNWGDERSKQLAEMVAARIHKCLSR